MASTSIVRINLIFHTIISISIISYAQMCSNITFSHNRVFKSCTDLPYLGAQLHWTYMQSTKQVSIAYHATQRSHGWIAWAINPTSTGMIGSQALVAFLNANGSMNVFPTSINSYNPSMQPSELSFWVSNVSAEHSMNVMTIFAVIGPLKNGSVFNHVWQAGTSVSSGIPQIHPTSPPNLQSMGRIDFLSS